LPPPAPAKIAPITVERYTLQVTIDAETHEKLRRVQDLLGHSVPPGDVAQVLDRALTIAQAELEKRKFAKVAKPRRARGARGRTIPAHVRRAVYQRDAGRCTFIGESGHRCESTTLLEFDHIVPVARGGQSTAANLRMVCRAHNQFAAEQAFGPQFMEAQRRKAELREDVAAGLRSLGTKATDARKAAANVLLEAETTIEEALKAALRMLRPKTPQPAPPQQPARQQQPAPPQQPARQRQQSEPSRSLAQPAAT
jgi:5-methylcytosine-specific restriction endonuclease McrA